MFADQVLFLNYERVEIPRLNLLRFPDCQGFCADVVLPKAYMDLTHDDVVKILGIIDDSSYNEIRLEIGDFK